jgi:hypothetical protein
MVDAPFVALCALAKGEPADPATAQSSKQSEQERITGERKLRTKNRIDASLRIVASS